MLYWATVFFVIALVEGFLGFIGIASAATGIAEVLFLLFLVLLLSAWWVSRAVAREFNSLHENTVMQ
jgi:uncharacterized membrane protein YtjA (UPF0391 family)